MRTIITMLATLLFLYFNTLASANECDAVLVQNIRSETRDLKFMLDAMATLEKSGISTESGATGLDATIPIKGIPVTFGFSSDDSRENRRYLATYNRHRISRDEAVGIMTQSVDDIQVEAWSRCMQKRNPFQLVFDEISGSDAVANLVAKNFIPGTKFPKTMSVSITGGSYLGQTSFQVPISKVGDNPLRVDRVVGQPLTIFAEMEGYSSSVALPAKRPPFRTPDIQYRVNGNLQQALVSNEIYESHNFEVTKGVLFSQSDIKLTIDQLVDGKVCQSASIATNALGDNMDSTPTFRTDRMYLGCHAKDAGNENAISVQCFVDPLHPRLCR